MAVCFLLTGRTRMPGQQWPIRPGQRRESGVGVDISLALLAESRARSFAVTFGAEPMAGSGRPCNASQRTGRDLVCVRDGGGPHVHAQLWWNAQQLRVVVADALLCSRQVPFHAWWWWWWWWLAKLVTMAQSPGRQLETRQSQTRQASPPIVQSLSLRLSIRSKSSRLELCTREPSVGTLPHIRASDGVKCVLVPEGPATSCHG